MRERCSYVALLSDCSLHSAALLSELRAFWAKSAPAAQCRRNKLVQTLSLSTPAACPAALSAASMKQHTEASRPYSCILTQLFVVGDIAARLDVSMTPTRKGSKTRSRLVTNWQHKKKGTATDSCEKDILIMTGTCAQQQCSNETKQKLFFPETSSNWTEMKLHANVAWTEMNLHADVA